MSGTPYICSLDIIEPMPGASIERFLVVDVNGARSGYAAQRHVYGDNRVEDAVLQILGEAGKGTIFAPSQTVDHPHQNRFGAERLRQMMDSNCGWYSAIDAYVPLGDPYSTQSHDGVQNNARKLGIDYRSLDVSWNPESNLFESKEDGKGAMPYAEWEPSGIVWPYSWNYRSMPLPEKSVHCNPAHFAFTTSNKLLLSIMATDAGLSHQMPPTTPLALLNMDGAAKIVDALGSPPLTIIKPLVGRRSFGVLIVPSSKLPIIASQTGVCANSGELNKGAELLAMALLWGEGHDLLANAQAYVPPLPLLCSATKKEHVSVIRAVISVDDGGPKCIDLCRMFAPEERDGKISRGSLLLSGSQCHVAPLEDRLWDAAGNFSTNFVSTILQNSEKTFRNLDGDGMVRMEAHLIVNALREYCDVDIASIWSKYETMPTVRMFIEDILRKNN